jgi:hypothetical protein
MPKPEDFADLVVLTVKAALGPLLERIASAEQQNAALMARLVEVEGLRDRVTVVETKAAQPVTVPAGGPTSAEIELLIRDRVEPFTKQMDGLSARLVAVETKPEPVAPAPVVPNVPTAAELEVAMRDRIEPLTKQIAGLSERVAVMEVKAPVPGPAGADGKDGQKGQDGADGLGFDDMDVEFDGDRTVLLKFSRGERTKSWPIVLPYQRYQGVYLEGKSYASGDVVTWGGSQWHANEDTSMKPGDGTKAWTLAVKRGRDGKDGRDAATGPVVTVGGVR